MGKLIIDCSRDRYLFPPMAQEILFFQNKYVLLIVSSTRAPKDDSLRIVIGFLDNFALFPLEDNDNVSVALVTVVPLVSLLEEVVIVLLQVAQVDETIDVVSIDTGVSLRPVDRVAVIVDIGDSVDPLGFVGAIRNMLNESCILKQRRLI